MIPTLPLFSRPRHLPSRDQAAAGRFQPSQSTTAPPITRSKSRPFSHGNSSVNIVTHCRYEHGMRVMSVPQNERFEDNPSFGTATVNQNNFDVTMAAYGIAVHPALIVAFPNSIVDGTCNWWDSADGPGPVGPGTGARVTPSVDYTPWLIAPAPGGACLGGVPSTPGKVTGGGQIESDPVFSIDGMLLSLPALVPSLADPRAQATFGFVVKCCPATGNVEYNDHQADVQIKAQSFDGLSISSPGTSCPATPGSKHATFGGTAAVIRSTGTTTEPFTVDVDDCGEPGTADSFGIKTTTYSNGPSTLIGGNIQIHGSRAGGN